MALNALLVHELAPANENGLPFNSNCSPFVVTNWALEKFNRASKVAKQAIFVIWVSMIRYDGI